jgi:hypothetical protein
MQHLQCIPPVAMPPCCSSCLLPKLGPPVHAAWVVQDLEAPIQVHLTFTLLLARDPQPLGTQ